MGSTPERTETDKIGYADSKEKEPIYTFVKRQGTSGIGGQIYEIYICMLMLLLLKENDDMVEEFYLGSNIESSGDFDDVSLKITKHKKHRGNRNCEIMFLQAKHRQNQNKAKKISLDMLLSSEKGDFSLKNYFRSYRTIKQNFENRNVKDPILNSDFGDCHFVIYTNNLASEKFHQCPNVKRVKAESDDILNFQSEDCYYYQLSVEENSKETDRIKAVLKDASDCRTLVKELIEWITSDDVSINKYPLIRKYHSALANEIIVQNTGKIRDYFIEGTSTTLSLEENFFRKELFNEIKKRYPSQQEFTSLLKDSKILVEFTKSKKKKKFLSSWVFMRNLFAKKKRNNDDFSLPDDVVSDQEIEDFLEKFKLFVGQPDKEGLETIIKSRMANLYKISSNDITYTFPEVEHKIRKWWEKDDFYLTKNNKYFEDSIRISIWYNVNNPVEPFTGRKQELEKLHEYIQRNPIKPTVISQMTSICGLGGIGKTELARKYAYEYSKYYDDNVIWINADSEETLKDSFTTLAKDKLQISTTDYNGGNRDITNVVGDIYKYFSKRKCLFIFDNADQNPSLYDFLPTKCLKSDDRKPFVLITSRNKEWEEGIAVLQLDEFGTEEAEEFLKTALNTDRDEDEAITQLIIKLQRFPLALQQAAAFINSERKIFNIDYSVHDYLVEYENQSRKLLDFKNVSRINNTYSQTTFTTWKMSFRKIAEDRDFGVHALKIFNLIAYCSPDKIPNKLFLELTNGDNRQLKGAIHLLSKYSLIKTNEDHFSVHRLVQEVTRINLESEEINVLTLLLDSIEKNLASDTINHGTYAWRYAKKYDELIIKYFNLWEKIILMLIEIHQYEEALSLTEELGSMTENKSDVRIWQRSKYLNAWALASMYRRSEAKELCKNMIEKINPELRNYLHIMFPTEDLLIQLTMLEGKYEEAETKSRELINRCIRLVGTYHPFTTTARALLAHLLARQEKNDEAISTYDEILKIYLKTTVRQDPERLRVLGYKAVALRQNGNFDEALNILTEVSEIRTKVLGPEHKDTVRTNTQLAITMFEQGKIEEATKFLKNILKKLYEIFEDDNSLTLKVKHDIAIILYRQGEYEEALNVAQKIYKKLIPVLEETHIELLTTQSIIAFSLAQQKKYEEALFTCDELLHKYKKLFHKYHRNTLNLELCKASILFNLKKFDEAVSTFQKIVDARKRTLGADHCDTLAIQHLLISILITLKNSNEAMNLIDEVVEAYIKLVCANHKSTLTMEYQTANVLWKQGNYDEALDMFNDIFKNPISKPYGKVDLCHNDRCVKKCIRGDQKIHTSIFSYFRK